VRFVIQNKIAIHRDHYWYHNIKNPIVKFLRHIVAPRIYPYMDDTMSVTEQAAIEAQRGRICNEQNACVEHWFFEPLERILARRRKFHMYATTKTRNITEFFQSGVELLCGHCSQFFTALDRTHKLCGLCTNNAETIRKDLRAESKRLDQDDRACRDTCHACVRLTGFPELDIDSCTKYDCSVHEQRSRLRLRRLQIEQKQGHFDRADVAIEYERESVVL
jgi:hypothetical protein